MNEIMKKIRLLWRHIKMTVFLALGLHSRVQSMFLNGEIVKKYSIGKLKRIVKNNTIPFNTRLAAARLYEVGEHDFAISALIKQMNLYLNPDTPNQIKNETCCYAAIELGRTKDERAIAPLFKALGELPFFSASHALAQINGPEVVDNLERLASLENPKGIHAIIALGLIKHEKAVPFLMEIVEHEQEFNNKYRGDFCNDLLTYYACKIIGLYDNEAAKNLFLSTLTKDGVAFFLFDYVHFARFPRAYNVNDVGWRVAKKYGWDKYINSEATEFVFFFTHISHWGNYCKTACPFKSEGEVDELREDIKNKIWIELGK
jgi:hypothetical protein